MIGCARTGTASSSLAGLLTCLLLLTATSCDAPSRRPRSADKRASRSKRTKKSAAPRPSGRVAKRAWRPTTRKRSAAPRQPVAKPRSPRSAAPAPVRTAPARSRRATKVWSQPGLVRQLEDSTVMVIAPKRAGTSMGTGFFVTKQLIVTNRHVLDGANLRKVYVISRRLGKMKRARLVKKSGGKNPMRDGDYAVLRLSAPVSVRPFTLTNKLGKLDTVIAAGFPGIIIATDLKFTHFMKGDISAVPEIALTEGQVSAIQNRGVGAVPLIVHTASMSSGNSGGPLIDACGRVVGINTFIRHGPGAKVNYTLAADHLSKFLRGVRTNRIKRSQALCVPGNK